MNSLTDANKSPAPAPSDTAFALDYARYDFRVNTPYDVKLEKGLNENVVREISSIKNEPNWMLEFRLKALRHFLEKPLPRWGADLSAIPFDDIVYYMRAGAANKGKWEDVPADVKKTFDRLGIPQAERAFLAGVGAQFDSEVAYHSIQSDLEKKGVVFLSMDEGLRQYPDLVKKYFSTVIPSSDNKFAALNSAVWSGGSFVYVPKGVVVDTPLQAYFRINAEKFGQFERTLIVVDEGAQAHYVEGCFSKGAPVQTQSGIKPIEDVGVGEKVRTHNNRFQLVYRTHVRPYTGNLNTIQYYGDSTVRMEITDEHPVLSVRRTRAEYKNTAFEPEWVRAGELVKGDYVALPIDRTIDSRPTRSFTVLAGNSRGEYAEQLFELKTDADFFRLIGYYLAEGTTIDGHYMSFTFHEKERAYLDDVKRLLKTFFGKEPIEYAVRNHGISLVLCSTRAARFFNSEFGHHAHTKHVPAWAMRETIEKQAELVKGYWRGDGSYMHTHYAWGVKRMFRMNSVSQTLARQIRDLLLRQNIFAGINVQFRQAPRKPMYCVHVGGRFLSAFAHLAGVHVVNETVAGNQLAYQKVSLSEAKSYAQLTEKFAFVPIRRIEKRQVENLDVYNFSVEEDESYVAHGVVVHNCTAPVYSTQSLHAAVVEVVALRGSKVRYTTIQNWANNIYNLVTKRAFAYRDATVEWVDGNLGSRVTMKYPAIFLREPGARGEVLSIAFASKGQHQDAGAKIVHLASNTSSLITSKSISKAGGINSFRSLVQIARGCTNTKSNVQCDALLLDEHSRSDTYPTIQVDEPSATLAHEAKVGKISADEIFYLTSRGIPEKDAIALIVMGFLQPFTKSLPLEYAVELNRLIELEMEGTVG